MRNALLFVAVASVAALFVAQFYGSSVGYLSSTYIQSKSFKWDAGCKDSLGQQRLCMYNESEVWVPFLEQWARRLESENWTCPCTRQDVLPYSVMLNSFFPCQDLIIACFASHAPDVWLGSMDSHPYVNFTKECFDTDWTFNATNLHTDSIDLEATGADVRKLIILCQQMLFKLGAIEVPVFAQLPTVAEVYANVYRAVFLAIKDIHTMQIYSDLTQKPGIQALRESSWIFHERRYSKRVEVFMRLFQSVITSQNPMSTCTLGQLQHPDAGNVTMPVNCDTANHASNSQGLLNHGHKVDYHLILGLSNRDDHEYIFGLGAALKHPSVNTTLPLYITTPALFSLYMHDGGKLNWLNAEGGPFGQLVGLKTDALEFQRLLAADVAAQKDENLRTGNRRVDWFYEQYWIITSICAPEQCTRSRTKTFWHRIVEVGGLIGGLFSLVFAFALPKLWNWVIFPLGKWKRVGGWEESSKGKP